MYYDVHCRFESWNNVCVRTKCQVSPESELWSVCKASTLELWNPSVPEFRAFDTEIESHRISEHYQSWCRWWGAKNQSHTWLVWHFYSKTVTVNGSFPELAGRPTYWKTKTQKECRCLSFSEGLDMHVMCCFIHRIHWYTLANGFLLASAGGLVLFCYTV